MNQLMIHITDYSGQRTIKVKSRREMSPREVFDCKMENINFLTKNSKWRKILKRSLMV